MMTGNSEKVSGPLAGTKVLDFCSFINGAYSASLMGDLGADVIKIEPLYGDLARGWGPFINGESRPFQTWNRSKRGIALDLISPAARAAVYELARLADVVIENFRPGVTEKLGIDYQTLREKNSRIIYCSSTAFGSKGPYRERPGYDPILQAISGLARETANYSGRVAISPVAASDYQASMLVLTGVLAALLHREKTGEGQRIETSLLQGSCPFRHISSINRSKPKRKAGSAFTLIACLKQRTVRSSSAALPTNSGGCCVKCSACPNWEVIHAMTPTKSAP